MTLLETLAAVVLAVLVTYLAGRLGRGSFGQGAAGGRMNGLALVDVADLTDRQGATVAPLLPAGVATGRAASRRRDSRVARRHYEALASEVARERRLAEYEALADEGGSVRRLAGHGAQAAPSAHSGDRGGAGGRVVPLHTRPSPGRPPAHR